MNDSENDKKTIYCCVWQWYKNNITGIALTEDGVCLAIVKSPSEILLKEEIGIGTMNRHGVYHTAFPEGYNLTWLDEPFKSSAFGRALHANHCQDNYIEKSYTGRTLRYKSRGGKKSKIKVLEG
jgi:hypothetical protein